MNREDIELLIKKIGVAMYYHKKGMYDYDMLVDYELDYNQWKQLLGYIEQLQQENKELHNKIDKAIDVIHTQMKNNPSYKENLKIIENNLIKGSCKVCDLKDSDVDG